MILNKLIVLSFFFLGCRSTDTAASQNSRSDIVKIITGVSCNENEEIRVDIDYQTAIYIDATSCSIFDEYTSKGNIVYVTVKGVIKENSFIRKSGYYWFVSKKDLEENDLHRKKMTRLEFSNFGLLGSEKLKENIAYNVFLTNFHLKRKDNSNLTKGKYELTFILEE